MHKAIQKLSQSLSATAVGIIAISLAGCAGLNLDGLNLNKGSYQWSDFLRDTDSNGSKSVELNEFSDYLTRQGGQSENIPDSFDDMDLDDSGSIDETEFARRRSKALAKATVSTVQPWRSFLTIADRNDDGNVNSAEWDGVPRKQANTPKRDEFNKYDINSDGQVTEGEYDTASRQ